MDALEAVATAKKYLGEVFQEEQIMAVTLEETEYLGDKWIVTLGFSRPWSTPRTRAQEVLENLGAATPLRRSEKTITLLDDGTVISMKDRQKADLAQ
jgi:hypothetical protein